VRLSKSNTQNIQKKTILKPLKNQNTSSSQYASSVKSFLQRVNRAYINEVGDGNCGLRSMLRQDNSCGEFAKITPEHIRNGRVKLASALQTYSSFTVNLIKGAHGVAGCIGPREIEERAQLHLGCDASKACDSSYYVGGFHSLDLIAWAMVTKRAVYTYDTNGLLCRCV